MAVTEHVTPAVPPATAKGRLLVSWLSTTDHKVVGYLYLITSFVFFLLGGVMAMVIRAELTAGGVSD
jgi:cytochrome c oxidase subunit 1